MYQTRLTILDAPGKGFMEVDDLLKAVKKKVVIAISSFRLY